ncbi:MAG: 4-alpha-glucanotransferase [Pirellulales bacterium]|nr:4-alpha-glucanotransferase [Pirellulales bacterium]
MRLHAAMGALPEERLRLGPLFIEQGTLTELPANSRLRLEDGEVLPAQLAQTSRLPLGYHELIDDSGRRQRSVIVYPPRCCWPAGSRGWGFAVQLYALRSQGNWGCGDFGDLQRLGAVASRLGARYLLLNPLGAAAPQPPQDPSPYSPSSRCFRNPLYLDMAAVAEVASLPANFAETTAQGLALAATDWIERDQVMQLKLAMLRKMFDDFSGSEAFAQYRQEQGELLARFTCFEVLAGRLGNDWRHWPSEYQSPGSAAVERFCAEHQAQREMEFQAWLQWLLDRQLAAAAQTCGLVQDLAVGFAPGGADAWMWRELVASDVSIGAPPDAFQAQGQCWGLAPWIPRQLVAADFAPWIATLRATLRHARGLRIDHVMGLARLFWVPDGCSAAKGAYVQYPFEAMASILALESHRAGAWIVGEDLGTVDPSFRAQLEARGILGYRVFWFDEDRAAFKPASLAAISTHDLPTIAGVWTGQDAVAQREAGFEIDEEPLRRMRKQLQTRLQLREDASLPAVITAAYDYLAEVESEIVMVSLEDAVGAAQRPNLPGATTLSNWRRRLPVDLAEMEHLPLTRAIAQRLARHAAPIQRRGGSE